MNVLIIYYSLSGTTRAVAMALMRELAADIEEIHCGRYSTGFPGFLRAACDSWRGKLPTLEPSRHAPSRYDLVVIGGPVWAFHPATPVRAWLRQEASGLPEVAFFLTHGGSAAEQSLHEMELLAGRAPAATLVVREAEVRTASFRAAVSDFAAKLRIRQAA